MLSILLLLLVISAVQAYQTLRCTVPDGLPNAGKDMGEWCVYTDPGDVCEANYYCPYFTYVEAVDTYPDVLSAANCTTVVVQVNVTVNVTCPCQPGFFCPENTGQPTYCPKGYYCPSNPAAGNPQSVDGLGTWGELTYECAEGKFCGTGQVEGLDCTTIASCPKGSEKENRAGVFVACLALFLGLYGSALIYEYRVKKYRDAIRLLNDENARQKNVGNTSQTHAAASAAAESGNSSSPLHKSLLPKGSNNGGMATPSNSVPAPGSKAKAFDIEFDNIGFTLKNGRVIMEGVYGKFTSGRTCAVMGPSGAGKTTIISLITGKAAKTEGTVRVNGETVPNLSKFKRLIGFVPQEDVMIRDLTVRDNINFSASFRLPVDQTENAAFLRNKVDACIKELGIDHVQDNLIGDERTRGISGGQRKRVNIGLELVADPQVLFLDEPTSGLDSTSSTALCKMLKEIAKNRGMTIAAVIHQPSISAFEAFDDLLLLGKGGRVVYHGSISEAPRYFSSIGFPIPPNANPADFYLDVCQGEVKQSPPPSGRKGTPDPSAILPVITPGLKFEWLLLFDMWAKHKGYISSDALGPSNNARASVNFAKASVAPEKPGVIASVMAVAIKGWTFIYEFVDRKLDVQKLFWSKLLSCEPNPEEAIRRTPSSFTQFILCLRRALKQEFVPMTGFITELCIHLAVGLAFSGSAKQLYYEGPYPDPIYVITPGAFKSICQDPQSDNYQQTASLMCFGVLAAGVSTGAATFGHEQVNSFRECAAGLNTFPYYMAKVIANIPKLLLCSLVFWSAFGVNFLNTGTQPEMYGLLLLLYFYAFGLGYFAAQVTEMKNTALLGTFFALIMVVKFSGMNPSLNTVHEKPGGQQMFWYLSGPRYILEGFYIKQVEYYKDIPSGSDYSGQPYIDIDSGLDPKGYSETDASLCYYGLFLSGLFWHILAFYVQASGNIEKKL
jgi:ABC-type multidrug transport system ATPase subunit